MNKIYCYIGHYQKGADLMGLSYEGKYYPLVFTNFEKAYQWEEKVKEEAKNLGITYDFRQYDCSRVWIGDIVKIKELDDVT